MELIDKLKEIQQNISCPKKQYNSFGKYKYRSLEDIFESLKPLLNKTGCVVNIADQITDGEIIISNAVITDGKNRIENSSCVGVGEQKGMSRPQQFKSAISFARKTALEGLLLLDDTDADSWEKPQWWHDAINYLIDGGTIEQIEKKYSLSDTMKQKLMDTVASEM